MAYSCGYFRNDDPDYPLEAAQRDKLDLVARKLGVRSGSRHLDIGCGWGSLSLHLAEHYGAHVIGVTLSVEQQAYALARARERGLDDRVEIRLQDYRAVPEGGFDSISAIEMGEHVGARGYPSFARIIAEKLRPQGRALIQQMSRRDRPGGGPFIESFIAPDMYMRPVGETVALLEGSGLEVRDVHALREHYVRTVRAWRANFETNWDVAVAMVGEQVARVWRLYLVGGGLVFEEGRMGVDQILAVRRTADGRSGLPSVRTE
jgi:cyclopropane-fatty-acyl-phospholipid synthase